MYCCPNCHGRLNAKDGKYSCSKDDCGISYPIISGKPFFRDIPEGAGLLKHQGDWLDRIKASLKTNPALYHYLTLIFSPGYYRPALKYKLINAVKESAGIIINLGSGNYVLDKSFINFDYYPYDNVDVVGDASRLPFPDQSVSGIISICVLEHLKKPELVMKEITRVLKKGGVLCSVVPFIQGYHASPYDYQRWTLSGSESLHQGFTIAESGVSVGPTSGLLWVCQEWLAMILSLGIKPLYKVFFFLLAITTWPLKYLDIILASHPMAKNIAGGFYIIAVKE